MTTRNAAAKTDGEKIQEAEASAETATRKTAARAEAVADRSQQQLNGQLDKFSKGFEGMSVIGQSNLDAMVKSSEIAARAAEGIGSEMTAYSKKAFEDSVTAAQDFASARTVTELFEKQTAFAQTAFEGWMHQASRMGEICVAAAKDITAPFGESVNVTSERMKSASF